MNGTRVADGVLLGRIQRLPEDVSLIHRLFERNISKAADRQQQGTGVTAVDVDGAEERVSYDTLNLLSNAVARRLLQHCSPIGADRQRRAGEDTHSLAESTSKGTVVIDVDPSIQLVIGLLATMKLGLAYVPVESRSTAVNRIRYILEVSQ